MLLQANAGSWQDGGVEGAAEGGQGGDGGDDNSWDGGGVRIMRAGGGFEYLY